MPFVQQPLQALSRHNLPPPQPPLQPPLPPLSSLPSSTRYATHLRKPTKLRKPATQTNPAAQTHPDIQTYPHTQTNPATQTNRATPTNPATQANPATRTSGRSRGKVRTYWQESHNLFTPERAGGYTFGFGDQTHCSDWVSHRSCTAGPDKEDRPGPTVCLPIKKPPR